MTVWLKAFLISPIEGKCGQHHESPALAQEMEPAVSIRRKVGGRRGKEKNLYPHPTR